MESINRKGVRHIPWNKGKLTGQKAPLKPGEIWATIDSKLRSCDLMQLRVRDICRGGRAASRAMVVQRKTQRPVQFEITESTLESLCSWMHAGGLGPDEYLFSSRLHDSPHAPECQVPWHRRRGRT